MLKTLKSTHKMTERITSLEKLSESTVTPIGHKL